ncbi:MAG TPA: DNA recombination protein RmuC [Burkholderiales bacterium]|jgi:DNA recombination protein RmuC|nr:DNA recombination protein RmuC [Burkholderiales bacterium]
MEGLLIWVAALAALAAAVLAGLAYARSGRGGGDAVPRFDRLDAAGERVERELRQEVRAASQDGRKELGESLQQFQRTLSDQLTNTNLVQNQKIDSFAQTLGVLTQKNEAQLELLRTDARAGREENANALRRFGEQLQQQLVVLTQSNEQKLTEVRNTLETRLKDIETQNAVKLEEMRKTVDEKLHATLEQRLGESFKLVSERLEQVHRGLGEMQTLAIGVGDLKRVLTNVKTRGTWGEVQLAALLEQSLTAEQYATNVATRPGSADRVEFAIRLPGREADSLVASQVWLPIDSKFPIEDYERIVAAHDLADLVAMEEASKALEARIKLEGKAIRDKYVEPPHTTDFAILFLPTEGLYAEVLRRPGLADWLQRECRVTIAGPTTLSAVLNSLQMGFRTLAIEKRASDVWMVLGAVKTEFGKFGEVLARTKSQLQSVANSIDAAETRTRQMERKLKSVEALPEPEAVRLLESENNPGTP